MTICASETKEASWGFCFSSVTDATNVPAHYPRIQGHVRECTHDPKTRTHNNRRVSELAHTDTQRHPGTENVTLKNQHKARSQTDIYVGSFNWTKRANGSRLLQARTTASYRWTLGSIQTARDIKSERSLKRVMQPLSAHYPASNSYKGRVFVCRRSCPFTVQSLAWMLG